MNTQPEPRKNATRTRGRPFTKGNPGRPLGARNRATVALQTILDGEGEALTRKAVELALDGDVVALRLCLERLLPPIRAKPINITLPDTSTLDGTLKAQAVIIDEVAKGTVQPDQGKILFDLLETRRRSLEPAVDGGDIAQACVDLAESLRFIDV